MDLLKWLPGFIGVGYLVFAVCVVVITNVRRFKLCNGIIVDTYGDDKAKDRTACLSVIFGLMVFVIVSCELDVIAPLKIMITAVLLALFWLFLDFCAWVGQLAKKGWIYERLFSVRRKDYKGHSQITRISRQTELSTIRHYSSTKPKHDDSHRH